MYRGVKVQEYVLFLEYFKLILNCSCVKKNNKKQKEIFHLVDPIILLNKSSGNNLLHSRILKRVNCINWELKFSMKLTMSSLNIYFTFYRNDKFYYKYLKHTSFSAWFDGSRV